MGFALTNERFFVWCPADSEEAGGGYILASDAEEAATSWIANNHESEEMDTVVSVRAPDGALSSFRVRAEFSWDYYADKLAT